MFVAIFEGFAILTLPMILLLDGSDPTLFAGAVDAFRSEDSVQLMKLLRSSDAIDRARAFAVEQVDAAVTSITGLDLGDSQELLRDLAGAVVDRNR